MSTFDGLSPSGTHQVLGPGGDLEKIRTNFQILSGVAVSGVEGLVNVSGIGATSGDRLEYDGSAWLVQPALDTTLSGLSDVDLAGAASGMFLALSGATWVPRTVVQALSGLSDVDLTGVASGMALVYDGSKWGPEARFLELAGGTMAGDIAMGSNKVTGLAAPTAPADAATKAYVDTLSGLSISGATTLSGLTDTMTSGAVSGSRLEFDGSTWNAVSGGALANAARCGLSQEAGFVVPYNASTDMVLDNLTYSEGNITPPTLSGTDITIEEDGHYIMHGQLYFVANSTGRRFIGIYINHAIPSGVANAWRQQVDAVANPSIGTLITVSCEYPLVSGDVVTLRAYQNGSVGGLLTYGAIQVRRAA